MKILESHQVTELEEPQRLIDYLIGVFDAVNTKKGLKKTIKKGLIQVDGKVLKTTDLLHGGERLTLHEQEAISPVLALALTVVYEDEHLAVVHKPAGIVVSSNKFRTLVNALPYNLKKSKAEDALPAPHTAHRLDYPTSGVILVGKTASCLFVLNQLFENKEVSKVYYAITIGEMPLQGQIDRPIEGKTCFTVYEVIETIPSVKFGQLNLVKLSPKTGRKHQLRIHLSGMGNPILGDREYGVEGQILRGKGLFLHAFSLSFTHPVTGESIKASHELPKKFLRLFPDVVCSE